MPKRIQMRRVTENADFYELQTIVAELRRKARRAAGVTTDY